MYVNMCICVYTFFIYIYRRGRNFCKKDCILKIY